MPYRLKSCLVCHKPLILVCKRDETRKKYCSRRCRQLHRYQNGEFTWLGKMQQLASTPEANRKKVRPKDQHPRWIADRSKVKCDRNRAEERWFFKQVLEQRHFTCELTGKRGGKLSVHHIKPVWIYPELRYDPKNVIVIAQNIHRHFHQLFSPKSSEADWISYVQNRSYSLAA